MDFTPELLAFQGTIIAANNRYSFNRLTSRGGNEEIIENVVHSLRKFILDKEYCTTEKCASEMSKLSFYLILNADLPTLAQIVELPNNEHLVWTTPTITTCLFSEIVWGLRIENYVAEVITYCNPKLSTDILKALVNGVRYCSAEDSLNKLRELAVASYHCLCRLSFFDYDNEIMSTLLTDLYTYFLRCITHFVSPPNNGKLEESPEEVQYIHLGKAFRGLLDVTLTCLSLFESPLNFSSNDSYLCTIDPKSLKTKCQLNSVAESSDAAVLEYVQKCNIAAVDKCVELVKKVSVVIFCSWSEHTEDGRSLQRSIGELCYRLLQKLETMSAFSQHMIMSMIPQIACKPVDIFDVIKEADDDALVANIQSGEEREHWLNAIIERSNLYESEQLTNCLLKHLSFLKPEASEKLFKKSLSYLQLNNYENTNVKELAIISFAGVDSANKLDLIGELFSNGILHSMLEGPNFDNKMNETFNKFISSSNSNLLEIYDIFLQNPPAVYEKMLSIGVENLKQANLVVDAFVLLKSLSEHKSEGEKEPAILNAVEQLCSVPLETEVQENSFVYLLSGLCKNIAVLQDSILVKILMPYVHKCVVNKDFSTLKLHLRVLREAYEVDQLVRYRAPLLVMLAQVLGTVRWDFTTYTAKAPTTLQEAIDLQNSLFSTYKSIIPDKDVNWFKTKLKKLQPLNMYYYKEIWNPPGENFIQVLTNAESIQQQQYPILLAKILNACTQKEWLLVWQSLVMEKDKVFALELMYQSLVIMSVAEINNRSVNSRACILYCYRCFITIVKENFLTNETDDAQVKQVLDKFVDLSNITMEEDMEETGAILLPLLASIISKKRPTNSFIEITNKLKHAKFAKLVQDVFVNTAT